MQTLASNDPRHIYSDELATTILDRMAAGESLTHICLDDDMPCRMTVWQWMNGKGGVPEDEDDSFVDRYARAAERRQELFFDDITDIADKAAKSPTHEKTGAAKLQTENRKWVLSRMNRAKYGDKSTVALEGGPEGSPPIRVQHTASLEDMAEALRIVAEVSKDDGE